MNPAYYPLQQPFTELWNQGKTYKQIAEILQISFNLAITLRLAFKLKPRMQSRYSIAGKLESIITDQDFHNILTQGMFKREDHKAYATLVYYSAVRREEARRALREYFQLDKKAMVFSVQKRLKHGIETPPLKLPLNLFGMNHLEKAVLETPPNEKVFDYCPKTCYNIMRRAGFGYTHHCRLSRITQFFLDGWTIPQVRSWTGLSLTALNYYLGIVDIEKMSKTLK